MFEAESRTLAAANANLERAVDQLAKANADMANVDQRITDLNVRKADISGRRLGGIYDREDGFDLAEIAVDLDGLAKLRITFAAGHEAAVKGHQDAVGAVDRATWALNRVRDQAAEKALSDHASAVLRTLGSTLAELDAVGKRLGRNQLWWVPDEAIAHTVHKANLQRAGVR